MLCSKNPAQKRRAKKMTAPENAAPDIWFIKRKRPGICTRGKRKHIVKATAHQNTDKGLRGQLSENAFTAGILGKKAPSSIAAISP